jgi:gliding motility-associated-like protein
LSLLLGMIGFLPAKAQFFVNGNAMATNDSCYQLTPAVNWQVGSIWNGDLIDLNQSFDVAVDLFLGCKDLEGADGMVFGLQPISTSIGTSGGDLGFGEVMPSLGVEFDTYQNIDYEDPVFDHITIIRDGILRHNTPQGSLAGPVQANVSQANVEDCAFHAMLVSWDADQQTLSVFFDCELRLTYTGDIINDVFNGDPLVYWGFTSATGGLNNIHEICFSYTSFIDELADQTICPGEEIQLEAVGGVSYRWSPAEGVSDTTIANPIFAPEETTLYTVEIRDECGIPVFDEVLITVLNDQFTVDITSIPENTEPVLPGTELDLTANVDPPTGTTYTYLWSSMNGSTFSDPMGSSPTVTIVFGAEETETIMLSVTSAEGCIIETSIEIEKSEVRYGIPNVFTPNQDNVNDAFGLVTNAVVEIYNCKVYNRWGQLVFETDRHSELWDGTHNGNPAPSDVYVYVISWEIEDQRYEESGDLTLIR